MVVGGGAIAQAAPAPSITVSEAPDGGGPVTITGSGFDTTDPGIYVGLGNQSATGFYSATLVGSETVWVDTANTSGGSSGARTEPMSAQGTFSFTITAPAGTDSSYAVFSSKAHGLGAYADFTQNVTTNLSYAEAPVETPTATPTPSETPTTPPTVSPTDTPTSAPTGTPTPPTPALTVSQIPAGGGIVTVSGTGFSTTDPGIYIAAGHSGAANLYVAPGLDASKAVQIKVGNTVGANTAPMNSDGSFTATLTLPADDGVTTWSVYASKGEGQGAGRDTTQNTSAPLTYATPVTPPTTTPTGTPTTPPTSTPTAPPTTTPTSPTGPSITATQIPTAGGKVTLTGTGFSATSPGIYLGVGPVGLSGIYGSTDKLIDSETIWIDIDNTDSTTALGRTAPMTAKGTFSVTVTLPAKSGITYAVYTSKAHGLGTTNTSQNTVTQLSYVGQPVVVPPTVDPTAPVTPAVPDAPAPSLSVSKIPARGGTVTVTGKNFSAQSPGIYLGVGVAGYDGYYSASRAGALITSQTIWIAINKTASGTVTAGASVTAAGPTVPRTARLNADGSFSVTVALPAPNGKSYAIYTSLASGVGSLDSSQNALAPLTYVAAAATTTPAAAAEEAPKCVARAVSGASLDWAIKTSFRSYISGSIANGSWSLSGIGDEDGRFVWSNGTGSYNTTADKGIVRFPGTLHFTGHDGALDITISDMSVRLSSAGSASVIASFNTLGLDGTRTSMSNVPFATIAAGGTSVGSSTLRLTDASTTLTANGATAFGGFYPTGQALAPLTLSAPLGASVECDSATFSSLALTGTGSPDVSLLGASALMLAGIGMLSIVRRRRVRAAASGSTES